MALILVVEDEVDLNNLIRDQLQAEGHEVEQAFDGRTALAKSAQEAPDLVILDWMLPDLDGLAVCRRLREDHLMPIIMLTARTEEVDRVLGLEVGADDYVPKPFSMRELLARARAALRRVALDTQRGTRGGLAGGPAPISHGPLRVDPASHEASLDGETLALTPKEFDILECLAADPGRVVSRQELLERVWDANWYGPTKVLDVHVAALRRKLGVAGLVETVYGRGFRLGGAE